MVIVGAHIGMVIDAMATSSKEIPRKAESSLEGVVQRKTYDLDTRSRNWGFIAMAWRGRRSLRAPPSWLLAWSLAMTEDREVMVPEEYAFPAFEAGASGGALSPRQRSLLSLLHRILLYSDGAALHRKSSVQFNNISVQLLYCTMSIVL
jgi:hypothetical protein